MVGIGSGSSLVVSEWDDNLKSSAAWIQCFKHFKACLL